MKRIIWTRPIEDWVQDQKIVKLETSNVFRFPVTRQVGITPVLPTKSCDIILLTSRKAAETFFNQTSSIRDQIQKVEYLTFGMETYKYLVNQKLKVRMIPVNGGKDFAQALVLEIKKGPVLWYPRPAEPAFAVGDHLRTYNLDVHDIELYRTEAIKQFDADLLKKLSSEPSVVCLASPSAVRSLVDIIRSSDEARFYRYTAVVIGTTTFAATHSYFPGVFQAAHPTLQSLWEKAMEIARQEGAESKQASGGASSKN